MSYSPASSNRDLRLMLTDARAVMSALGFSLILEVYGFQELATIRQFSRYLNRRVVVLERSLLSSVHVTMQRTCAALAMDAPIGNRI